MANNRLEYARVARPTRKSDALLLAAQAGRWATREEAMVGLEPSRTALATAYMRAAHQLLDSKPLLLEDEVAVQLLGKDATRRICAATNRYQTAVARALRSHVVLRSRYAEDQLFAAVQQGVSQYVVVGAGYDTFSLRQPRWAKNLEIVEVDHPRTQSAKLSQIAEACLKAPTNVTFAAIDFESETLEEGSRRSGISAVRKSFFSWLGVTMYLTEAAIDETLRYMASFPAGSQTVLTFSQPPAPGFSIVSAIASRIADHVESIGEPFVSHFEPEALRSKLRSLGLLTSNYCLRPMLMRSISDTDTWIFPLQRQSASHLRFGKQITCRAMSEWA